MYKLKQVPEDFIVTEKSAVRPGKTGQYSYFLLKKRNYNTVGAAEQIARKLNLPVKFVGFAGSKDRNAVTEQTISIKGKFNSDCGIETDDLTLRFLGRGDEPVSLGDLEGNHFKIVVRNIEKKPEKKNMFVNYFGEQRFGRNNVGIGRAILKKDFKRAAELIDDRKINESLRENPNDFIGAIKKINKKIRMMYIHAFQSYVWNKTAEHFKDSKKETDIPVVGFGAEYGNKEVEKAVKDMLKKEGASERDFVIPSMPELSSESGKRRLFAEIEGLEIGELEDDELNNGKKKCEIRFFLKKGSYATVAIASLF